MNENLINTLTVYKALTVVSPMIDAGESKNQDRARWYGCGQVAGIFDGVSSSPESARAAELGASFIPVMFNGNPIDNLNVLCDLLIANRQECQENKDISLPDNTPPAMIDMLRKVVRQKRSISFQTTMVAAKFIPDGNNILANVIKCGDSAFFAFSPNGQLLTSSLTFAERSIEKNRDLLQPSKKMSFGPGDEILVRIESKLSDNKTLLKQSTIRPEHAENWLICTAVDSCCAQQDEYCKNSLDLKAMSLNVGDQLLVPKYLYGTRLTSQDRLYLVLRYSNAIRHVSFSPITTLASTGSATMVLPDHFYCGCYDSFQDRFPCGTNFVLCSDGFYSCFSDWKELWRWLLENKAALHDIKKREAALDGLHILLRSKGGDDDISFIWASPHRKD